MICAGESPGSNWRSRAPTAAAWGAAADVPKKRSTPPISWAKNVVRTPSVAAKSGLASTCGAASGVVDGVFANSSVTGPRDEKSSDRVLSLNGIAAVDPTVPVPLWPKIVGPTTSEPIEVLCSTPVILEAPSSTNFSRGSAAPANFPTTMLTVCVDAVLFVKPRSSNGCCSPRLSAADAARTRPCPSTTNTS